MGESHTNILSREPDSLGSLFYVIRV